jgi:hypothetical protein
MSWVRPGALLVAAAAVLAGCSGTPAASARASKSPSPALSPPPTQSVSPVAIPTYSAPPVASPTPPASPTRRPAVKCGKLLVKDPNVYWSEQAVPPATCTQARSILPRAFEVKDTSFTISGWRCLWSGGNPDLESLRMTCTKGSRTLILQLLKK